VRYEVLGPLRIVNGGHTHQLRARKVATLLVVLLRLSDRMVTVDRLIAELWGDNPPRRATATIQVYISQLRRFLTEVDGKSGHIATYPSGYMLRTDGHEMDAQVFHRTAEEGRRLRREQALEEATLAFKRAAACFRGPVLADLQESPTIATFSTQLEEARVECAEDLVEVTLEMGLTSEALSLLYALIQEHPLRESFYRQLMLAFYRVERRADALKVFHQARHALQYELGLEPGHALQELQRTILRQDVPTGQACILGSYASRNRDCTNNG
jgi:DNA-binding SARP family transcriptional activator